MPLKSKSYFICALAIFLALAFTFTDRVSAEEKSNIHIGALEIHPSASVTQIYDTNIFLEPGDEEDDDFITDIGFGIEVKMPLIPQREDDFMLEAFYQADIIRFWDRDDIDRVDHTVRGSLYFAFKNDFRLRIEDNFEKTADPPNSELTALEKRLRNILDAYLVYDREKIRIEGGFRMVRDSYDNFNNLDKTNNMFSGAYFYQIFPKTSIFGEYDYGMIEYDTNQTNSDSKYYQGRLGVKGNLWPKLTGTVKAGYRHVGYDESGKDDFSGFTLFGNIRYNATERTVMNLYTERTSQESSYVTNSHFEVNNIGIKLDHQLSRRLLFNGESFFQLNRYPDETTEGSKTAKREDKFFSIGAGLSYEIKEWWLVSAGYKFKQRASNFDVFDYNDHRIFAQALVLY